MVKLPQAALAALAASLQGEATAEQRQLAAALHAERQALVAQLEQHKHRLHPDLVHPNMCVAAAVRAMLARALPGFTCPGADCVPLQGFRHVAWPQHPLHRSCLMHGSTGCPSAACNRRRRRAQLEQLAADEQRRQAEAAQQLLQGAARCSALASATGPLAVALLRDAATALLQLLDGLVMPGDLAPAAEGERCRVARTRCTRCLCSRGSTGRQARTAQPSAQHAADCCC